MDNLARDSSMAIAAGMSYGKWKALHPHTSGIIPERPKEKEKKNTKPVRLCRWCGKEIPASAHGGRKYCDADCQYAGQLRRSNERYRVMKGRKEA